MKWPNETLVATLTHLGSGSYSNSPRLLHIVELVEGNRLSIQDNSDADPISPIDNGNDDDDDDDVIHKSYLNYTYTAI